jgi:monoamine oxidase
VVDHVYDDGRSTVPGGLIGPVERVVVIGAGMSGLTVASALRRGGVDCVVLEARDRIGGRLHTIDLAGTPVDLGGSWIHHPIGNPMRAFADQVGVACDPGDPLPTIAAYDVAEHRRLDQDEVDRLLALPLEEFPAVAERMDAQPDVAGSGWQAVEMLVADAGMTGAEARRARQTMRAVLEADAADLAERVSLDWLATQEEYEGDLFGDLPQDGYRSLVSAMADGLDVRLGVEAASVEVVERGVRVHATDGSVEAGTHVVVTVPLGVLKAGLPSFAPPLPGDRVKAIDGLGFGRYEKVVLVFETAFWAQAGLSHLMVFPADEEQPTMWVFDLHAFGAGPALAAHVFHSATSTVAVQTSEEAAAWLTAILAEVVGAPAPEPVAAHVTSWSTDPFARGAYTHVPIGAEASWPDLLGEPVAGRICFAGEHTQLARAGYADGALSSGVREAKRLLGRPTVRLGRGS